MPFIAMNQWYEKYINIPYKLFSTDPDEGLDCCTLMAYIFKQELGITIPYTTSDLLKIADDEWYMKSHDQHILDLSNNGDWIEVEDLEKFDLILMCVGSTNVVNHVAMYLGNNKILQMLFNRNSDVYNYHRYFKQYTIKKVRWKNLKN